MANLSKEALNFTIEHLIKYSDTNFLPIPFEYEAIKHNWDEISKWIVKQDITQWQCRTLRKCLVPKNHYGFRPMTQLDPLDTIIYTALIYEIGDYVEKHRIPQRNQVVYSYRFMVDKKEYKMFDDTCNYVSFVNRSKELSQGYPYVLITDIADFYPRIYLHRIETSLSMLEKEPAFKQHYKAILNLIKSWNQRVSFGIPVGTSASNLIAELVIDDIDKNLLSENIVYCRYVDDYRIFCKSKQEAHRHLAFLANMLFDMHGLTLQQLKTQVMTSDEFINKILEPENKEELKSLADNFKKILKNVGITDPYVDIDVCKIDPALKTQIDSLNLEKLVQDQAEKESIDISMSRYLINRFRQLKKIKPLAVLYRNIEKFYPVFADIIRYTVSVKGKYADHQKEKIGTFLLKLIDDSFICQIEYHRCMALSVFSGSEEFGNKDKLANLYKNINDQFSRRCLILALGKYNQDFWFRRMKKEFENLSPWERRAFLLGINCLPKEERDIWYKSINSKLDLLEKYIIKWIKEIFH